MEPAVTFQPLRQGFKIARSAFEFVLVVGQDGARRLIPQLSREVAHLGRLLWLDNLHKEKTLAGGTRSRLFHAPA